MMPRSMNSMLRSGDISMSKLAVLKQTRVQKSKMAKFGGRNKDEGQAHGYGAVDEAHIDSPTLQKRGSAGRVSKGGGARGGVQPKRPHIDGPMTRPKWPAGGGVSASNPKTGNTRMKGKIPAQGGLYGGGGRSTQ